MLRAKALVNLEKALDSTSFFGASPPGLFVGAWGYPNVFVGPLVPATSETDTAIMDASERWTNKTLDELLRYRFSLIRGKELTRVTAARTPGRLLSNIQETVMSSKPTDIELWLRKKPNLGLHLSPREAPIGPSAPIERVVLTDNPSIPRAVENAVSDDDLKANSAVWDLYSSNVPQSQITKILASGTLGRRTERKLVPTEWSITAVDDIIGKRLGDSIYHLPVINEFNVYGKKALGNNVHVLLLPSPWMYEALEAWTAHPNLGPINDYELGKRMHRYPRNLLGAYHAARLAVLEHQTRERRQAGAIVFLEVHPEWIPLGVWRFRELLRDALISRPLKFSNLKDSLEELKKRLTIPIHRWTENSRILRVFEKQSRMETFLPRKTADIKTADT